MSLKVIGVLDDREGDERRVALVPGTVRRLVKAGTAVMVERGAGSSAWYPDPSYLDAGATVATREEILERADALLTVAGFPPGEAKRVRRDQLVIGMLAPAANPQTVSQLAERGAVVVSLEGLPRTLSRSQAMDVLSSQASVAGYKAALVAANAFGRYFPLLITAAGTSRPASVLVIGAGVAGLSAIGTARRLGALVTGYDVRPETRTEVESLGAKFLVLDGQLSGSGGGGYARALDAGEQQAQQAQLEDRISSFDVIITTAQVPGRRPPLLVTAGALAKMQPGAVVVDLAASPLGGNVEGSAPGAKVVTERGVTIVGASDLASGVPTAASDAFSANMAAVLGLLVRDGEVTIDLDDEVQAAIVIAHQGRVVHPAVLAAHPQLAPTPDSEDTGADK